MATFDGTGRTDTFGGSRDADSMRGNGGRDTLDGKDGNDTMWGGGGNDAMTGGNGDDVMYGSQGARKQVDMSTFSIHENAKGKITFDGETAGYKNALGMYKIGADGTIYDAKVVFANASLKDSGGDLVAGKSAYEFDLKAGERIGFFVVPNAYEQKGMDKLLSDTKGSWKIVDIATGKDGNVNSAGTKLVHIGANGKETDIKSQYGVDMFHSTSKSLNRDGLDHTRGTGEVLDGKVKLGFEDLWKGGDNDFDDSVFTVDIGVNNAMKLTTTTGKAARWQDDDVMDGGEGNDVMFGGAGRDKMDGGAGNDKMSGGSGDDKMTGGAGDDLILGNSGNDLFMADAGDDRLFGGSGFDTVDFSGAKGSVDVNLAKHTATGMGTDTLWGIEAVIGSASNDSIVGDKRANVIDGGAGNDTLRGLGGIDTLTGGEGDDTFVFLKKDVLTGADLITDFEQGDVLDLHDFVKGGQKAADVLSTVFDGENTHVYALVAGQQHEVATLKSFDAGSVGDMLHAGMILA